MKEITKLQIVELMRVSNIDGVDNEHSDIIYSAPGFDNSQELVGGDYGVTLPHGAYLVVYSMEPDISDFPHLAEWINKNLGDDNIEIVPNEDYTMLFVYLTRFE